MKRGQLTATTIISLVILIIGFVIILIAGFTIYDLYHQSEDEVCRLSILERATVPSQTQTYIPLKCTTKKICLSLGEDCPPFLAEKNVKKIKLPSSPEKAEEAARKIEEVSANAHYDCWSITGKGFLDLTTGLEKGITDVVTDLFKTEKVEPACMICARVALSPELQKRADILQNVNVIDYMQNTKVPGSSLTYLQTFTDEQITSYPSELDFKKQIKSETEKSTTQIAYVFTQILVNEEAYKQAVDKGLNTGIALGTGLVLNPFGNVVSWPGKLFATVIGAGLSGGLAYYNAKQNIAMATTHCSKLTTPKKDEEKFGCTFVLPVNYNNITLINQLCKGGILGSP